MIWITLINNGYIEYTKNFLKSIEINNKEYNSITQAAVDIGWSFGKLNWCIKNNKIKYKWLKK